MKRTRYESLSSHSPVEKYRKEISRCVRCGSCRAVCPSFLPEREESLSARGRMALIEWVLDNKLPVSAIFKDRLATCTGCLACEASCPSGVPVTRIIQAAKEQAVHETGIGLINSLVSLALRSGTVMRSLAWLSPLVLRYAGETVVGKEHRTKSRGPDSSTVGTERRRGRVAFFVGCAANYFQEDMAAAVLLVLRRLGFDVIIPEDQKCCGRPLLSLGDRKAAEELAAHNNALFAGLQAEAVVTACASCGLTFKKEYSTLLAPLGKEPVLVVDIHEFLAGKMSELNFKPVTMRVTYHDPCHLGRGQGLSKTARGVLRSVPGLELVEMENADCCCGFGGVMRITRRDLSDKIGEKKAEDIITTKASVVATGCPGCRMQIADSLRRRGSDVKVLHAVQVLEAALRNAECGVRNSECAKVGG